MRDNRSNSIPSLVQSLRTSDLVRCEELDAAATQVAVVDAGQFAQLVRECRESARSRSHEAVDRRRGPAGCRAGGCRPGPRRFLAQFAAIEHLDR